jgi:hypothetical protein
MDGKETKTSRKMIEDEMKKVQDEINSLRAKHDSLSEKYENLPEVKKEVEDRWKRTIKEELEIWFPYVEEQDKWAANWLVTTGLKLACGIPTATTKFHDIGDTGTGHRVVTVRYRLPWKETIKITYDGDENALRPIICTNISRHYVREAEKAMGCWESFIKNDFDIKDFDKEGDLKDKLNDSEGFGAERYLIPLFLIAFASVLPLFIPEDDESSSDSEDE